jgi:hypothetical protein
LKCEYEKKSDRNSLPDTDLGSGGLQPSPKQPIWTTDGGKKPKGKPEEPIRNAEAEISLPHSWKFFHEGLQSFFQDDPTTLLFFRRRSLHMSLGFYHLLLKVVDFL